MLNIESVFLSVLIIKSAYLSALIIVDVVFFDVSHTPHSFYLPPLLKLDKDDVGVDFTLGLGLLRPAELCDGLGLGPYGT